MVEWVEDELVAAWLGVAESTVERECRERDLLQKTTEEEAGFFLFLDPIFSSLRSSTEHLFIGSGRGSSRLHRGKISALDLVGKDPNRWFKVASLSCQIYRKRLPELTSSRRHLCRGVVIHPETFTWDFRRTTGDPFRASFVRFDG